MNIHKTLTLIHHKNFYSLSEIMLKIQKAEEFPILIKFNKSLITIENKEQATFFSLGIIITLEAKEQEKSW